MTLFPLRALQQRAIDGLRESLRTGHRRPIIQAATGFGKTIIAAHIVHGALAKRKRVAFSVPALSLIDQTFDRFVANGIDPGDLGVMQADHAWNRPNAPIQICSIQTLARRGFPEVDFVVLDEVHIRFEAIDKWMDAEPSKIFVGLSASPWSVGLGDRFDDLIIPTSIDELTRDGFLAPLRAFAPTKPDLSGIKMVAGDYHEGELAERMSGASIVADVVMTWLEKADDRPTLLFAVNRAHADLLQRQFVAAGVSAAYVDANTEREERTKIGRELESGRIKVICSVGTMCLDEKTEILTTDGWVGIDAMTYEHKVAAWSEHNIEFTKPLHIVRRDREPHEKMVVLSTKNHDIRVTSNHRMIWSKSTAGFSEKAAGDCVGQMGYLPVSGMGDPLEFVALGEDIKRRKRRIVGLSHKMRKRGLGADVALAYATEHQDHIRDVCRTKMPHELSIDECHFLGFWTGDGSRTNGRITVIQSKRYTKIIEWFGGVIERLGLNVTCLTYPPSNKSKNESFRWCFSTGRGGGNQRVNGGLASIAEYLDKNGSPYLWGLDVEQFRAFLFGYWMADGNHGEGDGEGRGWRIRGLSLPLFELIQAVGACRGFRFSVRRRRRADMTKPFYEISGREMSSIRVRSYRLEFEEGFKNERVWCITSTTGNIITRRAGKVTVMGNTTGVDLDIRCISYARPTKSEILWVQSIGRGLRTAGGKADCILLDHSGTALTMGLPSEILHTELLRSKDEKAKAARKAVEPPVPIECPQCQQLIPVKMRECPGCGYVVKRLCKVVVNEGELIEIGGSKKSTAQKLSKRDFLAQLKGYAEEHSYKPGWPVAKFRSRVQEWPHHSIKDCPPQICSNKVRAWIRSEFIRFAKRRPERSTDEIIADSIAKVSRDA